jgi:hypothetical protein
MTMRLGFPLLLLTACHSQSPVATATPMNQRLARTDSLVYAVVTDQHRYFSILALTPGQAIERLAPADDTITLPLEPGRTTVTFPNPRLGIPRVARTLVLVLLDSPLTASDLDRALPPVAAPSPAVTLDALRTNLGLRDRLKWVPLTWETRSAI